MGRLGERLAVLTVGGVEPRKGSLTACSRASRRCASALPERDPVLLIAGGTTLFDYRHEVDRFTARARELDVTAHVRVLGALAPDAIERLYRAADVFAFPSVKEGFGLAALEALAADLPVVASDLDVFRSFLCRRQQRAADAGRRRRRARRGDGARRARRASCARGCAPAAAPWCGTYTWDASADRARARSTRSREPADAERGAMSRRSRSPRPGTAGTPPRSRRAATRWRSTSRSRPAAHDAGLMPTELLCAALASCFCLALGHVARQRDVELPGLRVRGARRARGARAALRARRREATADVPDERARRARPAGAEAVLGLQHAGDPSRRRVSNHVGEGAPRLEVS